MKKRAIIGVVAVVMISVVAWLLYQKQSDIAPVAEHEAPPVAPQDDKVITATFTREDVDAEIKKQNAFAKAEKERLSLLVADDESTQQELERIIAENPRAKKMYYLYLAAMENIEFYGQVVDQDGDPIDDVDIYFSIGTAYGIGQPGHATVRTDENGNYTIKGFKGASVRVYQFVKHGYKFPKVNQTFYAYAQTERPYTWKSYAAKTPFKTVGELN